MLKAVSDNLRNFIESELLPLESSNFLNSDFSKISGKLDNLRVLAKEQGLWNLHEKFSLQEFGHLSSVMASTPYGIYVFNSQAPDIGNMELLHKHGNDYQKNEFLEPLKKGEIRSCFGMTEPDFAGSNPVNMGTLAQKVDGGWIINGKKWFTTGADGASFCIVMAVSSPDASKYQRASMFIVPTQSDGYELVRNISIMGETGDGWHSHSEIKFENCFVPDKNLLGIEGEGFKMAQERLGPGRIHHCMRWVGIAERCFDIMCKRVKSRDMGDGQYLADKQIVMAWIAECRVQIDAAKLLVLKAAQKIDVEGASAARNHISGIKFFTANMLQMVIDKAIQVGGAAGITDDYLVSFWYRSERAARIYDGADEVHKIALAKSILKNY